MQSHHKSAFSLLVVLMIIGVGLVMPPGKARAQAGKSIAGFDNICLTEARRAEAQHGIPKGLLQSISRVEAGRKTVTGEFMPWAWTLNDKGEGLFFDSREAAMRHLQHAVAAGDHSVDVGCMQVNTKWHMGGFHELADMLDPVQNADYAAGFLLDLHEAHQSWDDAVKHYHSAEPKKHVVYHKRVLAELEKFLNGDHMDVVVAAAEPIPAKPTEHSDQEIATELANEFNSELIGDLAGDLAGELALRTPVNPVSRPVPQTSALSTEQITPVLSSVPPAAVGLSDPVTPVEKQPNLAPHWDRVEHFRRLLAERAG